jgi:hypothetical protein
VIWEIEKLGQGKQEKRQMWVRRGEERGKVWYQKRK